jgi:hypothetical protein
MRAGFVNISRQLLIFVALATLPLFCMLNAQANQPAPSSNDDLQLKVWIDPDAGAVVSQQINLYIELATRHWFTGGTRIGAFEIDDAVVLRREKFAVNSTRIQDQQTWTVQLWTLTLYPQRAGDYVIPQIKLDIPVADENGEPSQRWLSTEPIMFSSVTPGPVQAELGSSSEASWVASTRLEVKESYNKASSELEVGDAIRRIIEFKSENIAAMMLPVLQFDSTPGLAIYQDPAKIEDKVNRGVYLASRTQVVTYVVEKAGYYTLPRLDVFWWDLTSQSLQREILAERIVSTKGASASLAIEDSVPQVAIKPVTKIAIGKIGLWLAGVLLVFIVWRWLRRRFGLGVSDKAESARLTELEQQYIEHCRLGHYSSAGDLLYQWLCRQLKILDHQSIELKRHDNSMRRWLASMNARHALKLFDHLMIVAHGDSLGSVKDHLKGLSNDPDKNMKSLETLPKEINRILNNTNIPSIDQQREFRLN